MPSHPPAMPQRCDRTGRLVVAEIRRAIASLARDHGEGHERRGDFVITSDGEEPSTVHGKAGLTPHIRALLPISGLARKARGGERGGLSGGAHFLIINNYCSSMTSAQ
jgi:hypothetical protein